MAAVLYVLCIVPYRANVELRELTKRSMLAQSVDPQRAGEVESVPVVTMAEALRTSDIISIHASGSSEIIGRVEFAREEAAGRLGAREGAVRVPVQGGDPGHGRARLGLTDQVRGDLVRGGLVVEHHDLHVDVVQVRQHRMIR